MKTRSVLILKTITYRLLGSAITAGIVAIVSHQGNYKIAIGAGAIDFIIKPVIYYLHELAWCRALKRGT